MTDRSTINLVFDLGDLKYLAGVRVLYTATEDVASPANQITLRAPGDAEWIADQWTTVAGANQSHSTPALGGTPARYIRVKLYGDADGCGGQVTLLGLWYTVVPQYGWREVLDFTLSPRGFSQDSHPFWDPDETGTYSGGWNTELAAMDSAPSSQQHELAIKRDFSFTTTIRKITVEATFSAACIFMGIQIYDPPFGSGQNPATQLVNWNQTTLVEGENVVSWEGSLAADGLGAYLYMANGALDPCGTALLTRIIVEGDVQNPFT